MSDKRMVIPPDFFGRSGLSDEQLAHHWARLRELYPTACEALDNPPLGVDVEESARSTTFIGAYLMIHAGMHGSDDWSPVYDDLLDYRGRQHLADVMRRGRVERVADYGIVRNSLECHPYRFSEEEKATMKRLMAAFEKMHPDLLAASGWKVRPTAGSWLKALFR